MIVRLMFPCLNDKNKTKFSGLQESQKKTIIWRNLKVIPLKRMYSRLFFTLGTIDNHSCDIVIEKLQTRDFA